MSPSIHIQHRVQQINAGGPFFHLTISLLLTVFSMFCFGLEEVLANDVSGTPELLSQPRPRHPDAVNHPLPDGPKNEFHIARLVFDTNASHGWGPGRPWWRIDWPEAEHHFINGLQRYTVVDVAPDSVHIELGDDALFDHPWLFAQQVGRWQISDTQVEQLGEYLRRGGFLLADDLHGPYDWETFTGVIFRALPEAAIVDIPSDDAVMDVLYELDQRTQIPGRRHIMANDGQGNVSVRMPYSPPRWRGIKDGNGRWIVAINFNMDMGDSWEHADDPGYPLEMTSLGYRFGINYVIYAITH
ncbi:MAG: DUF4159 domain-containing protein [Gammaproteobacteria bacterium]|nr:DUF4159 domain-containing protein [Gammaproteobacteria bacterium]